MFLINIIDFFQSLSMIQYLFVAFGFFGVNLSLQFLILNKRCK